MLQSNRKVVMEIKINKKYLNIEVSTDFFYRYQYIIPTCLYSKFQNRDTYNIK